MWPRRLALWPHIDPQCGPRRAGRYHGMNRIPTGTDGTVMNGVWPTDGEESKSLVKGVNWRCIFPTLAACRHATWWCVVTPPGGAILRHLVVRVTPPGGAILRHLSPVDVFTREAERVLLIDNGFNG